MADNLVTVRAERKPIRVCIHDAESGELLEEKVVANDYLLITAGNRYLKHIQIMGRTHMLAVAVEKPGATEGK